MAIIKRQIKRADGSTRTRWRARYTDDTRSTVERHFETKREATRWLTEQKSALNRGDHIHPSGGEQTFADLADDWRDTWTDLEPKTRVGYESILNRHVLPRWGTTKLGGITPKAIQKWVNELAASRAPNTVRRVYSVLRQVLGVAVERRYLTANPCDAVRLPKSNGPRREQLFLSPAEVQQLAEAVADESGQRQYGLLVYTAAYTGLRAGELAALRQRDVTADAISVERALKEINSTSEHVPDKGLVEGRTKTGAARRVGLPRFLRAMLAEHLAALPADPEAFVFTSPDGGPLRHGNFYRRFFKPAVKQSLPPEKHRLRFHDLRHTCAGLLIEQGVHPKAIQEHLGHRDIQTTFNVYGHLLPSAHEALAAKLDTAYASANGSEPAKVTELAR